MQERVHEGADQAGEAWYVGLFQALGEILVGLVVLVVVALVIAAIAAAFGVILTAWTAVMAAGALLSAAGFVFSLVNRFSQAELADTNPLSHRRPLAMDTVGITGIVEGLSGKDIVTGQVLSDADNPSRRDWCLHAGDACSRCAVCHQRTSRRNICSTFRSTAGWVGWRNAIPSAWRGIRSVGVELYTGLRQGIRNIKEWIQERLGQKGPSAPEEPGPGSRPEKVQPTARLIHETAT